MDVVLGQHEIGSTKKLKLSPGQLLTGVIIKKLQKGEICWFQICVTCPDGRSNARLSAKALSSMHNSWMLIANGHGSNNRYSIRLSIMNRLHPITRMISDRDSPTSSRIARRVLMTVSSAVTFRAMRYPVRIVLIMVFSLGPQSSQFYKRINRYSILAMILWGLWSHYLL